MNMEQATITQAQKDNNPVVPGLALTWLEIAEKLDSKSGWRLNIYSNSVTNMDQYQQLRTLIVNNAAYECISSYKAPNSSGSQEVYAALFMAAIEGEI